MDPVLAIRITNAFERFIKELVRLYNFKEGKDWVKSDMGRHMLEIAAPIISERFEKKYEQKILLTKEARALTRFGRAFQREQNRNSEKE